MKNNLFALTTLLLMSATSQIQAKQTVCIFDLMGKAGETFKVKEEWAIMAKNWQADIRLIPYQDEAKAQADFDAGKCDAVYLTSMRARKSNRFAGSQSMHLAALTNNQVARKAIHFALDKRNKRRLLTKIDDQNYDVAGILQFGLAYVFVRDRNLNTIEKAKGKKFNNNQVDAIAAPAYAFKPLEIERAISKNGAMFSFPVVNITGDLIIHPEKFPENFAAQHT